MSCYNVVGRSLQRPTHKSLCRKISFTRLSSQLGRFSPIRLERDIGHLKAPKLTTSHAEGWVSSFAFGPPVSSVSTGPSTPQKHITQATRHRSLGRSSHPRVLLTNNFALSLKLPTRTIAYSTMSRVSEGANPKREEWQIQKKALKEKFGDKSWEPLKRLSPDALEGIRTLHTQDPGRHSTEVLAEQFKVSPEAIRRILKSKWRPTEEQQADRQRRWIRRGKRIWTSKMNMGMKPPKRWRAEITRSLGHRRLDKRGEESQRTRFSNDSGLDIKVPKGSAMRKGGEEVSGPSLSRRIL